MDDIYAYPLVGTTGLCNMFYPWARAVVWARDNCAKVIAPNWVQFIRLGVWLRGDRDKRTYIGQFSDKGYITGLRKWLLLRTQPQFEEKFAYTSPRESRGIYVFSGREEWGWMEKFKNEAMFLRCELERIVNPQIISRLAELPKGFIGVHIRKGDFLLGDELQEDDYYLKAIKKARNDVGDLPVLVFSDGKDNELRFLEKVDNLKRASSAPAVHDVLALSRARAIIGTNHSTFSYWAAFLSCGVPSYWSSVKHKTSLPEDVCPVIYV